MPLLTLPNEVLHLVIFFFVPANAKGREYGYRSTRARLKDAFQGMLHLSCTCSGLRKLVGRYLFSCVSLVRRSEIDSMMAYPRRMDSWSDGEKYRSEFMNLVGTSATLASSGSSYFADGGIAAFVTKLEARNESLYNDDLLAFPNLAHLAVLAEPPKIAQQIKLPAHLVLRTLAINIETLMMSPCLMRSAATCNRLDLFCDFNTCNPNYCFPHLQKSLVSCHCKQVNLFVSDAQCLRYPAFLSFLESLLNGSLQSLTLRVNKKACENAESQNTPEIITPLEGCRRFVMAVSSARNLRSLTMDLELVNNLNCDFTLRVPQLEKTHTGGEICFTLVDYALSVPKLLPRPREVVANIIRAMQSSTFTLVYGEVVSQAQLQALSVTRDLVSFLSSHNERRTPYSAIHTVHLSKAWSASDDGICRSYYESLLDTAKQSDLTLDERLSAEQKIVSVSSTEPPTNTSSRYKQRETFKVGQDREREGSWPMVEWNPCFETESFWSVETSFRDLEHYSARERVLSSLWA
ncbi:hypothetical protein OXX79_007785 [Metschnikowia pulcherrima]